MPSDAVAKIKNEVTPRQSNDAAKPLSDRQSDLAAEWVAHLRSSREPMPREMRRRFFDLYWEEQEERSREGRPLRIPTAYRAHHALLLVGPRTSAA